MYVPMQERPPWTWAALVLTSLRPKLYCSRDGTLPMTFYTRPGMSVRPPDVAEVSSVTTQRDASGSHRHDATRGVEIVWFVWRWAADNGVHLQQFARRENRGDVGVDVVVPGKSQISWGITPCRQTFRRKLLHLFFRVVQEKQPSLSWTTLKMEVLSSFKSSGRVYKHIRHLEYMSKKFYIKLTLEQAMKVQ